MFGQTELELVSAITELRVAHPRECFRLLPTWGLPRQSRLLCFGARARSGAFKGDALFDFVVNKTAGWSREHGELPADRAFARS